MTSGAGLEGRAEVHWRAEEDGIPSRGLALLVKSSGMD